MKGEPEAKNIPEKPSLTQLKETYESELSKLRGFLIPHKDLWYYEVLNNFPTSLKAFPSSWIKQVENLNEEAKWQLDCGAGLEFLEGDLLEILKEIEELEAIPRWPETPEIKYPSWALFKVGGKKQHEIHRIVPVMPLMGLKSGDTFVDIGGGKGHLPRILCLYHGHNAITLDTNQHFQELGMARLKKYPPPEGAGELTFINHTFGPEDNEGRLKEEDIFQKAQASLGLHTCGPLSLHHLSKAQPKKGLLNFPCCYNKLEPEVHTNLSDFLQKDPFELSKHSLTLASRGHTTISFEDYQLKKQVKLMRAALHFYLHEKFGMNDFITVGSAHARDYRKDFDHYARLKIQQLALLEPKENLNDFFEREDIQEKVRLVYYANIIRWRWGRILEKYLIYDRALSLVEKGHIAEVYQFFDEKLSPRNLGILIRA